MRWTPGSRSTNLEDRRGSIVRRGAPIGIGGLLLVAAISYLTGQDFFSVLGPMVSQPTTETRTDGPVASTPEEEKLVDFVSFVLDDAQGTWQKLMANRYRPATLVLFRDATESACGFAQSASGPFYCPADEKLFLDLSFFEELRDKFGAPGDFAQAYVIAHEIGHHVQNVTGIEARVRQAQASQPQARNDLSVRMELQADCFAGVWGNSTARRDILEEADAEEGLRAAASIGDDQLQKQAGGRVRPESFTHGSAAQRVQWLRTGLSTGDPDRCDTFGSGGGTN